MRGVLIQRGRGAGRFFENVRYLVKSMNMAAVNQRYKLSDFIRFLKVVLGHFSLEKKETKKLFWDRELLNLSNHTFYNKT